MGVYYHYVNLSKKERFAIDSLGGGIKHSSLGRSFSVRAFHLMLEAPAGRWSGDQIAVMGDDETPDWDDYVTEYADIEADAILLVVEQDGFEEMAEAATSDTYLFLQLCYLVLTHQASSKMEAEMEKFFPTFRQRYKELRDTLVWEPKNVVLNSSE